MTPINFVTCIKTEYLLKNEGIKWEIHKVPLSKISWGKSSQNAGRVGRKLDESTVEEYGLGMLNGDPFPYVCLAMEGNQYVIVCGNHRCHGAKEAGFTHVTAYIIKLKHEIDYRIIAFLSNRKEGLRENKSQAIAFAADIKSETGCTAAEAAKKCGLKTGTLQTYLKGMKVRQHCNSLGLKTQSLSQSHMIHLNKVMHSDNILRESVKLASIPSVTAIRLGGFMDDINEQRTEAKQLVLLEDILEDRKSEIPRKRGGITMDKHAQFNRTYNKMASFVNGSGDLVSGIDYDRDSDEFKSKKANWPSIRRAINGLFK